MSVKGTIYTRKSGRQLTEKYFSVKEKEVTNNDPFAICYQGQWSIWTEKVVNST